MTTTECSVAVRKCGDCGNPLSRYNPGNLCQACASATRKEHPAETGESLVNGRRIAKLRRSRGMTQQLFADRTGLSISLVTKIEVNILKTTSLASLYAMARVLRVPVSVLLGDGGGIAENDSGAKKEGGIQISGSRPVSPAGREPAPHNRSRSVS